MLYCQQEVYMTYLNNLKERFTFDQLLLIFTCFSFTFPFYILGPILLIEFMCYNKFAKNENLFVKHETQRAVDWFSTALFLH